MATDKEQQYRQFAARGKYQPLYTHLSILTTPEWKTTFSQIESIIGFVLPASARLHPSWWSNHTLPHSHSQALAWRAAGWATAQVDMNAQTLLLRRKPAASAHRLTLDEAWPVHSAGAWPQALSLTREEIY